MRKKKAIAGILITVCIVLACAIAVTAFILFSKPDRNTISQGVSINTVDVSNMTREEAIAAVSQYIDTIKSAKLTVLIDGNTVEVPVASFIVEDSIEEVVDQAMLIGKTGNFIKRYQEIKQLEKQAVVLPLTTSIDEQQVKTFVQGNCTAYDVPAENAELSRENGVFVVTDHTLGRAVNVDQTAAKVLAALGDDWKFDDVTVEAVVDTEEPEYTSDKLALCKDVLGTFSTTYATSSQSRANNLANGARLINGTFLYPGEVFSTGKAMQPITSENGYSMAGAYENGQVVDSIGGGVCQVATTLYNAVLKSELEITERSNHSMIVGYVSPSMDAAIAGDYKDLKFKNNTDIPIYIEATTVGRTITFTIYGHETRDLQNRVVKYESKVLQVIQPGKEKVTKDKTLPESYRKVTQAAHVGYKAELWKVVYEDGVEVSRERINSSSYAPEPAYVTIGTMKEEEDETDVGENEGKDNEGKEGESPAPSKKPSPSVPPSTSPSQSPGDNPEDTIEE